MRTSRTDDLFALFPDLPRPRRGGNDGFLLRFQQHVAAMRARARANMVRQRAQSETVQAVISSRRRR